MPLSFALTFLLAFAIGPLVVLALMRRPSDVTMIRKLGVITMVLVVVAIFGAMFGLSGAVAAFLLWASWVMSMATVGHVMRMVIGSPGVQRWAGPIVAVGAALPWFGILMARVVAA